MRFLIFLLISGWTASAAADLYRWVDPESGSVKFSSYPPPWYNESAADRRMPKVERIPERSASTPVAPAPAGGGEQDALEGQRRAALLTIDATLEKPSKDKEGTEAELQRQVGIYREVTARLDRADPAGRDARGRELQRLLEKLGRGPSK